MPNQTNVNGNLTNEQKAVRFDLLVEELARVTAERDVAAKQVGVEFAECVAIRASVADWKKCADLAESALASEQQRNAELEEKAERYRLTTLRQDARLAELEAALREEKRIHPEDFQPGDFRERALARAESATPVLPMRDDPRYKGTDYKSTTPAKHPDTVRLDWLCSDTDAANYFLTESIHAHSPDCLRAAIDAARKQGGAT